MASQRGKQTIQGRMDNLFNKSGVVSIRHAHAKKNLDTNIPSSQKLTRHASKT
jgi:hypothetical protein